MSASHRPDSRSEPGRAGLRGSAVGGEDGSMNGPSTVRAQSLRLRRGTAGATVVAGLALLGAAVLLMNSWRSQLPDPVASHWGVDGPNGYSTVDSTITVTLVGGVALVLGFGAVTLFLGHSALTRRIGAGATIWSAFFLSIVAAGSLYVQRGLADARDAGGIGAVILVAVMGSLAAGIVVAIVVPGDPALPTTEPVDADAPRVALDAGDGTVWLGTAESRVALAIGLVAAGLMLGFAVLTQLWALLIAGIAVFGLVASMSVVVVRIDRTGVSIRSPLGWPRTRIPLDEVVRANVIDVRPLRDFGGWGWRVGLRGRVGIVLRGGESLLIERTGGRSDVVTVDGALVAAGTLNALADRERGNPSRSS